MIWHVGGAPCDGFTPQRASCQLMFILCSISALLQHLIMASAQRMVQQYLLDWVATWRAAAWPWVASQHVLSPHHSGLTLHCPAAPGTT